MSAVKQTTVTPFSVSHLVMVQLSSPPEAAKATVRPFRSLTVTEVSARSIKSPRFSYAVAPHSQTGEFTVDEWDAMGHGMKVDRRSTDWGIVSVTIGACFLIMAPIMLTFNMIYWLQGGVWHQTREELEIA